jgi:hypothetical protein
MRIVKDNEEELGTVEVQRRGGGNSGSAEERRWKAAKRRWTTVEHHLLNEVRRRNRAALICVLCVDCMCMPNCIGCCRGHDVEMTDRAKGARARGWYGVQVNRHLVSSHVLDVRGPRGP